MRTIYSSRSIPIIPDFVKNFFAYLKKSQYVAWSFKNVNFPTKLRIESQEIVFQSVGVRVISLRVKWRSVDH